MQKSIKIYVAKEGEIQSVHKSLQDYLGTGSANDSDIAYITRQVLGDQIVGLIESQYKTAYSIEGSTGVSVNGKYHPQGHTDVIVSIIIGILLEVGDILPEQVVLQ